MCSVVTGQVKLLELEMGQGQAVASKKGRLPEASASTALNKELALRQMECRKSS